MNTPLPSGLAVACTSCPARSRPRPRSPQAFQVGRAVVCYASTRTAFRTSPTMSTLAKNRIVGTSVPRKEGVDKLRGTARYVDDIQREGMWHGATVRSTVPRALIRSISFDRKIDWSDFTVVTAADIPGENHIQMIVADQPCLADGKVNHCEEAILLIAHPDKHKVREAVDAVKVEYEPLPAVFTIEESERQDVIVWGADN